jgi:hypothetical protein
LTRAAATKSPSTALNSASPDSFPTSNFNFRNRNLDAIDASIANGSKKYTYGEFYDRDGVGHQYESGQDGDAYNAQEVGREIGVFPARGTVITVEHIEVKVAARMRQAEVPDGVLVINNPGGPCGLDTGGQYSCSVGVPRLLPLGTGLVVWWSGGRASVVSKRRGRRSWEENDDQYGR